MNGSRGTRIPGLLNVSAVESCC